VVCIGSVTGRSASYCCGHSIGPALAAPLGQPGTACRVRPDTGVVIDMSEISSGRSWSGGEGSFSDRKSLFGCETWRLAPHCRGTHCSALSNSTINTRMVQGHEIIKDFLHGTYCYNTWHTESPLSPWIWTPQTVPWVYKMDRRAAECVSAVW
jgi:hypothetical protein